MVRTQEVPEANALFFSRVAAQAKKLDGYHTETKLSDYTAANVFTKIKKALGSGKLRRYKAMGALVVYVRSEIMDLLEQSTELAKKIEMTQIAEGGIGIETRVTKIDGVPVFEVIDDEVFYDTFNFDGEDGGFAPAETTYKASTDTSVVAGKTYYTKSGSTYTPVKTPTGDPSTSSYYEVDTAGSNQDQRSDRLTAYNEVRAEGQQYLLLRTGSAHRGRRLAISEPCFLRCIRIPQRQG